MRKKLYTEIGIKRLNCIRCNKKAAFQWQFCADNHIPRPLCVECDIELNKIALEFLNFEDSDHLINEYRKKVTK